MIYRIEESAAWIDVPFLVQKPQDGWRVDSFLAVRLHRYSRTQVQRLLREGRGFLRGRPAKASARVTRGDTVVVRYSRKPEPPAVAQRLGALYEDDHLLAVNKPPGVLSHPTDKVLENTVTAILRRQRPELEARLAHRLDRETSGVLLLAKTAAAAASLNGQFFRREVSKDYLALARGRVSWRHQVVDAAIAREGGIIKVRQAAGRGGGGAVTEFVLVAAGEESSLILARPRTGRLHQIRVHLAHVGHPVIGDKLYNDGGRYYLKAVARQLDSEDLAALGGGRQMLHAASLSLRHPFTGAFLRVDAPLPDDFLDALARRGLRAP